MDGFFNLAWSGFGVVTLKWCDEVNGSTEMYDEIPFWLSGRDFLLAAV